MPTVIDSLLVELGLDTKNFSEGQRKAAEDLRKLEENARKHTGGVQDGFEKLGTQLANVQGRLLGIAAIFLGGMGLTKFAEDVTKATNALYRLGQQSGETPAELSAWANVGRMAGANPQAVQQAVSGFSGALYGNQLTPNPQLLSSLAAMNIRPQQRPDGSFDVNGMLLQMSQWTQGRNPAAATAMLNRVPGMNSDMITLLLQGPDKLRAKLEEMKKLGPTPEQTQALNNLTEQWGKMSATAEKLGRVLLTEVEPVLEKILKVAEYFFGYSADVKGREQALVNDQNNATTGWERFQQWRQGKRSLGSVFFGGGGAELGGTPGRAAAPGTGQPGAAGDAAGAQGRAAPSSGVQQANRFAAAKQAAMEQLRQEGVPEANLDAAASALVGQATAESNLNPNLSHDGGTGYGVYGARLERRDRMLAWLRENGYARNSLEGQMKYMAHEAMSARYGAARRALLNARPDNLRIVNGVLTDTFESPAIRNYGPRYNATVGALHTAVRGANAGVNENRNVDNSRKSETNVGEVHVHTQATSPYDIAVGIRGALINTGDVAQSNTGPW